MERQTTVTTQTRNSIFETNSSSSHSMSLGPVTDTTKDIILGPQCVHNITLGVGEYGWGEETLEYWTEKADYLSIETQHNPEKKDILEEAIKIKYPEIEIQYDYCGYIDHQSAGELWVELGFRSNLSDSDRERLIEKVYELIFGTGVIDIDNDNH